MGSLWWDLAMALFFDKKAGEERAARKLEVKLRERQSREDDDKQYKKLVDRLTEREQNRAIQDRISREWDAARRRR
jgi:hypothetical protein